LMIASMLAVLKAGKAYVPMEPDFPVERIRDILQEAEIRTVITQKAYTDRLLPDVKPLILTLPMVHHDLRQPAVSGEDPAYILYTSGSTGRPKGVCVLQRNLMHYVRAFHHEFHNGPGDIMLQGSVCTFDIFVEEVFTTLLNGAALAIPHTDEFHARMQYCEDHGITFISGFPWLVAQMNSEKLVPSRLRILISGGDTLHHSQMDTIADRVPVYNTYGPSETTVCASYYCASGKQPLADGSHPIGRPVLGASMEILDEAGNPVPTGTTGEICIYGNGVSAGYIGDHTRENLAFDHNMYHSGDLGYQLPDGNFVFLGRKDRQVMVYGKRVEPEEVESVMEKCPGVQEAVVTTWMDPEGSSHLHGWIVPEPDPENEQIPVAERDLTERLKSCLSRHLTPFMIPESFTVLASLPRTANGKVDKEALDALGDDKDTIQDREDGQ
ncbi:amino acid adenylation domain-containing protein, partial [Faecalibaculum rodentium]